MVETISVNQKNLHAVTVGSVHIGGSYPVVVQSMTNTDTADIDSTVQQVKELADAGSELVRITVDTEQAARCVAPICEQLNAAGYNVPIIGDFHYNGHTLLDKYPDCAKALAKYRINPGNVGFGKKKDDQFAAIIETAIRYKKAVRIGVNWGSLDQKVLQSIMDDNAQREIPWDATEVMCEALVKSALDSAAYAETLGLPANKIIISCKVSEVQELISVYQLLDSRCDYVLHLGLTEAGMGSKGIVSSTAALAILLQQGIGDTIRISLTPEPGGAREKEVIVAQELLQSMGLRAFAPMVTACPGCGRTTSTVFQQLAMEIQAFVRNGMNEWRTTHPGVENMKLAVMGCIVNGPGESKQADIGISLPGTGEAPAAPVFIDGKKAMTLRGDNIFSEFREIVLNYINQKYPLDTEGKE